MNDLTTLAGKIVAFEGLDGAGKSTVIEVLAGRLKAAGKTVFLPRLGKDHSSRPTRMIRELTRDRVNIELRPRAEMALYCAREAQILAEQARPAIARGEVVLLDRSILTAVVLGAYGRGLPRDECETMARIASGGLEPDVTVILDVHPRTSRIRKRLGRARDPKVRDPSRKGLGGSGLKERVRDGYQEIARERGYPLFHTERVNPQELSERVIAVLAGGARPSDLERPDDAQPRWQVDPELSFDQALAVLPDDLALYMSRGLILGRELRRAAVRHDPTLAAWGLDAEDPLREELVSVAPQHALSGWVRKPLAGKDDLRIRMQDVHPRFVAKGLRYLEGGEADRMREALAERAPSEVVESLCGREDSFAEEMRARLWKKASVAHAAASLVWCTGDKASRLRASLFERDPAIALRSIRGLDDARSREWMTRYAPLAPKAVLRALTSNGSEFAHSLRRQLIDTGREAIDSLGALQDDTSMALREAYAERWPSTVLGSLSRYLTNARVSDLIERCKRHGVGDVHLLRQLAAREEYKQRPEWQQAHDADLDAVED